MSLKNVCLSQKFYVCMLISYSSYVKRHQVNLFQYTFHEINEDTIIKIIDTFRMPASYDIN